MKHIFSYASKLHSTARHRWRAGFSFSYQSRLFVGSSPKILTKPSSYNNHPDRRCSIESKRRSTRWHVTPYEDGSRLDRFIKRRAPSLPKSLIQKQIRKRLVDINEESVTSNSAAVQAGDVVQLSGNLNLCETVPDPDPKENILLLPPPFVLYYDARCIVLNKPPGLQVQAGRKHSLEDALQRLGIGKCRLVHRLDKDVSGAIVVARDVGAAGLLSEAFRERKVRKIYIALVRGSVHDSHGTICDSLDGKTAVTVWNVVHRLRNGLTWMELEPRTGRKHQLRRHCAHVLKTPILGDTRYGSNDVMENSHGLHLCSRFLSFRKLPTTGGGSKRSQRSDGNGIVSVVAPLPLHMKESWSKFDLNDTLEKQDHERSVHLE